MKEKIILGLGNNIDYEVGWTPEVLENLVIRYGIRADELSTNLQVNSERDLVVSILGFIKSGSGGERFVASSDIVEQFAQNFDCKITLGGTSVRAAITMRKLGYTSALHLVTINDDVRRLIPPDNPYVCSSTKDSSYPHLIIQFGKDAQVKAGDIDIRTNRANRIIYHNDVDNILMNLNEDFSDLITDARIFLISGFNAMQSQELLANRLESLLRIMERLPRDVTIYYEDACFYDSGFSKQILSKLADRIRIYSLNEDELETYLGRDLNLLNAFQIKEALADIHKIIPIPLIVVHTTHWALAYGEKAMSLSKALQCGITMATTRFRMGDDFTVEDYLETEQLPPCEEGVVFAGELKQLLGNTVCCVPVAQVEEANSTSVGLGDSFVGGFLPALLQP